MNTLREDLIPVDAIDTSILFEARKKGWGDPDLTKSILRDLKIILVEHDLYSKKIQLKKELEGEFV